MDIATLRSLVTEYYLANPRDLPWRTLQIDNALNPYHVLVSELMLQQTQVTRVVPKYQMFLQLFPAVDRLAQAQLSEVLIAWQGLGYNRRAKFLHQSAQKIVTDFQGEFPRTVDELTTLPGVGYNTAGAILAYAYNLPVSFIETNIRTVFLHHLFSGVTEVSDTQIMPYIAEAAADHTGGLTPREWYWALMDYGTYLKSTNSNPSRRSKHHVKQSKFEGSRRQLRGKILRLLADSPYTIQQLMDETHDGRLLSVVDDLLSEQLIHEQSSRYLLGSGILS